jgi:hypothetical protein
MSRYSTASYVEVAAAINETLRDEPHWRYDEAESALIDLTTRLADIYEADNPRFDRDRFFAAALRRDA